jgi:AraC-like DNA-binding protein
MLFNDAGLTGAPVDEIRQAQAAVVCALLGMMLDPRRGGLRRNMAPVESRRQWLASTTLEMLDKAPGMGGKEIAAALRISVSRLARVFKAQVGMSLVEYRNRLRLDRFAALLEGGCSNLLEAALNAGFGSYAQFYRVFRARLHAAPKQYLRSSASRVPRR